MEGACKAMMGSVVKESRTNNTNADFNLKKSRLERRAKTTHSNFFVVTIFGQQLR